MTTPSSGQFRRQYMQFGNSAGNFDGRSGMIRRADCRNWLHFYRISCRLFMIFSEKSCINVTCRRAKAGAQGQSGLMREGSGFEVSCLHGRHTYRVTFGMIENANGLVYELCPIRIYGFQSGDTLIKHNYVGVSVTSGSNIDRLFLGHPNKN